MIILKKQKICFVHIPKNAGTSVSYLLINYSSFKDVIVFDKKYLNKYQRILNFYYSNILKISKHIKINEIIKKFNEIENFSFFLVFRDPISRVKSIYRYQKKYQNVYNGYDYNSINHFIQSDKFIYSNGIDCLHEQQFNFFKDSKVRNLNIFTLNNDDLNNYLKDKLTNVIDFNIQLNSTKYLKTSEDDSLNTKSINIIKKKYKDDFIYYDKLQHKL